MLPFQRVFMEDTPTTPRTGDRFIYDRRNGTLQVHRENAPERKTPWGAPKTRRVL